MTRHSKLLCGLLCTVGLVAGTSVSASVTFPEPTITFSDLKGGDTTYIENGYKFDPTSFQVGNCSPFPTANDPCIKEVQQSGLVTTMTNIAGLLFSLNGFYFDMQGTGGQNAVNELRVSTDKTGASPLIFRLGQLAPTGTQLYFPYTSTGTPPAPTGTLYNGLINNNDSYFVTINSDLFRNVKFVTWETTSTANVRIDDISVSAIPLPAAGWLLLAGIGGLAAARRMKKAA